MRPPGSWVTLNEQRLDLGDARDLARIHALVRAVDGGLGIFHAHGRNLSTREGALKEITQRDRSAVPGHHHVRAVCVLHGIRKHTVGGSFRPCRERGVGAVQLHADPYPPRCRADQVGYEFVLGLHRVGAWRDSETYQGAGSALGRRRRSGGRRAVDAKHGDRGAGPEQIGHRPVAEQAYAVKHSGVRPEPALWIPLPARPGSCRVQGP